LAQGLVCGFYRAIFYLLLVGGWRMGGRGGRGHGPVTFLFWYLAAGTAREACGASGFLDRQSNGNGGNRDIVMGGPAGQTNERGLMGPGWLAIGTWSGAGGLEMDEPGGSGDATCMGGRTHGQLVALVCGEGRS